MKAPKTGAWKYFFSWSVVLNLYLSHQKLDRREERGEVERKTERKNERKKQTNKEEREKRNQNVNVGGFYIFNQFKYALRKKVLPSTSFWRFRLSQIEDSIEYLE